MSDDRATDGVQTSTPDQTLEQLAERIGGVSASWRASLGRDSAATLRAPSAARALRSGIETIYEGYALHFTASRVLHPSNEPNLQLLIGDWCYAAGLCEIADTGNLDAVSTLADLIADVAIMAAEPDPARDTPDAPDPREVRWDTALDALAQ